MRLVFIVAVVGLINSASGAETVTKNCTESSFCRRCRSVSGPTPYRALLSTLYTDTSFVSVEILNEDNGQLFQLILTALQDNSFHFEIDEKSPIRPRYRVTEVLAKPPSHDVIDVQTTSNEIIVNSKLNKAIISAAPFKIDFYQNGVLSLSVNSKNLMKFEHRQQRPVVPDPSGDWEETWQGFTDSKPNGPEAIALDFTFHGSEVLFGIPEHQDTFALKATVGDEPYRIYTLDVTFYDLDSRMPNYGAIPVIYGHGSRGTAGIFWQNSADTYIDIHDTTVAHFMSEGGIMDVFVLLGPSPNEAFSQYTSLTGHGNLPQLFTLGYHQSRWNYMTQEDLLEVVSKFDEHDIPLDTMWLDIEYTDQKKYFTWNKITFPEPLEMMNTLRSTGRHLTYIIDPHIKKDDDYFYYVSNKEKGYFVKDKDGNDYEGSCWPGMSSYVDFFNPEARRHYADQFLMKNFVDNSIETGLWNDMNEPVVFDVPEKTFPKDAVHFQGWEHRYLHSQYAFLQTKGTFDGMMRRGDGKFRPFILTRAFFAGSQRYSAVWTGDNIGDWGYLQVSIKTCLAISAAGVSFCGSDIGGFFGNPENELFTRWNQAAAYQPFFRNHGEFDSDRREPYVFPQDVMENVRESIRTRYTLLPLWYTMFFEHERYGLPIMRPMLAQYPLDKNVFKLDDQYMLSDRLLVSPVMTSNAASIEVYFPSTDGAQKRHLYYDFDDYRKIDFVGNLEVSVDINKIPVFQRGGTIVPKKEVQRRSSVWMRDDPVSLYVAVDEEDRAQGTLYIDDEVSYDYRRGNYLYINFSFERDQLALEFIDKEASYPTNSKVDKVIIAGLDAVPSSATLTYQNGSARSVTIEKTSEEYFTVSDINADLTMEWRLLLNGSERRDLCMGLLFIVLATHFLRNYL